MTKRVVVKTSICIAAHNEERNIGRLLTKLVHEALLDEIVVVASGCTDKTVEIAQSFSPRVKILIQLEREGKASAINLFLSQCDADIVILESADTLPGHRCFEYLLSHFDDETVGMAGAHPIPTNSVKTLMGRISHLIWKSHHQLALRTPKAGEVVAFRHLTGLLLDSKTSVDEAYIEREITKNAFRVVYEPKAVIFNRGPETLNDFVKQRKRIYGGHKVLKQVGYEVPTMNTVNVLKTTLKVTHNPITLLVGAVLELYCRLTAPSEQQTVWQISTSTKVLR